VRDIHLTETGVAAQVKGNYKDHYAIEMVFTQDGLIPNCNCPLEEPWCKHAVAVGLTACTRGLWHAFFGLEDDHYKVSENIVGTADLYMGSYRVFISENRKPNKVSIKLQERQTGRLVKQIEPLLMQIIELQTHHNYEFNDATLREINLLKFLYHLGFMFTKDGWYHVPVQHAKELIDTLSLLEEVCTSQLERVVFEQTPLRLNLAVNVSMAGNVLVSLHWIEPAAKNVLPLEEVRTFALNCPFGLRRNRLYPLSSTLNRLPKRLIKTTFTDIRDAEGGKFMYEELPRLKNLVDDVDESDLVHQLTLAHRPPTKMLNVEMMDPALLKIRVSLDFRYDTVTVPYSKGSPKTPYVMVVNKDKEQIYWVKRDTRQEKAAYQQLQDSALSPLQTNYLFAEGDDAIDFFNTALDRLGDEWEFNVKDPDVFGVLKVADDSLKVCAAIDFDDSVDYFRLKVYCRLGKDRMDIDDVRDQMIQGKKYFLRGGSGYVEIPLAAILQFNRTLIALEAEKLADDPDDGLDVYRIETFKVGLLQELTEQGVELDLSEKFGEFWKLITSTSTLEDIPVPDNVDAELRPYQKQGFNWLWFLYNYGLNGILADDMGLGKTLQTLVLLQYAKNTDGHQPSLVVCPSSVVYNWVAEARKFVPDLKVIQLTGSNRKPIYKQIKDADVVVTSYSIMRRDIRALKGYAFRHVVLDESQNIKNWTSQTAAAAKQLKCNHRLAISGTPIENRLLELWSVFDFLMPKFLYDIDEFRYRFVTPIEEKGNIDAGTRLKKQVFPFILRRLKQDVAKDLPPKIENVMYCDLTEDQQELYMDTLERTRDEVLSKMGGDGGNANAIFAALMKLRQICCHPQMLDDDWRNGVNDSGKFDAMKDMLRDVIGNGHRVLVYSQFVEMLKIMRKWLEVEGIRYEYLTGDTPSADRGPKVDRFNNDEDIPVFLISLKAGGTGLNLTGADYVVLYDPWWNPAAENQAADRAHRIGQTKSVMVYRMVARGTVEEKIMKLKDRKQDLVDSIISADRAMGKSFSFEELKDILTPDF
jgi:superfamily II DNA or RNA helicase